MATAWVEEYEGVGYVAGTAVAAPKGPALAVQAVTFTTTAGITVALNERTRLLVLSTDATLGFFQIGFADDIEATTADVPILGGTYRPIVVDGGGDRFLSFVAPA